MEKTMLRKLHLGVFVLVLFCTTVFTACAQAKVSGKYDVDEDEDDSMYSYFDFKSSNSVIVCIDLLGYETTITYPYTIKNGSVLIKDNKGVLELKIIDANTLEGVGNLCDGVRFIKESSEGQSVGDFRIVPAEEYYSKYNGIAITAYLGNKKVVQIPPKIQNIPVTIIGEDAFANKKLTSVTIPNSVKYISEGAFSNNQLTSVTIPNSVEMLEGFENNQLTSVTIPNSVRYLEGFANNKITSITIPNSVTQIMDRAFSGNLLKSVTIPDSVTMLYGFDNNQITSVTIPNSVEHLGGFKNNKITTVTIPNSVTSILGAFSNNQITSVTIPDSVTKIDLDAFSGNPLTSITIPSGIDLKYSRAFTGDFVDVYIKNKQAGGTYRADANNKWRKE